MDPTLWNVLYDEILDLDAFLVAYADDLAIVVAVDMEMVEKANETMSRVDDWVNFYNLSLAL